MCKRIVLSLVFCVSTLLPVHGDEPQQKDFDVIIAGGSTAAFAAAIGAAQQGATVALIEPTDWVGGQITSSGVPAIDEAWHKLAGNKGGAAMDVAKIARTPANMPPLLRDMLDETGCPGDCWVSRFCFLPKPFLDAHLTPLQNQFDNLTVFKNTVVKSVRYSENRIQTIVAIRRTPKQPAYVSLPSVALPDWYSETPSARFDKQVINFSAKPNSVFIDATEWGEVLALSDAPYLIGVETSDGSLEGNDKIGQSITFGFVQKLHEKPDSRRDANIPNPPCEQLGFGDYEGKDRAWQLIWTYRRLASTQNAPTTGDLTLQNWGYYPNKNEGGNDYPFGYLFLDNAKTKQQRANWIGGVDLEVMSKAEERAFAWHHYFKSRAPDDINADRISLDRDALGTVHGLSKLPYIRDTRRSIGLDNFLLKASDLAPTTPGRIAKRFEDRIALGAYPIDIHPLADTRYPDYINDQYETAPFTIPFRALTNKRHANLLVAGKTMAQSFLANSATRLHPIEWSTGTAAGISAAYMSKHKLTSREALGEVEKLQGLIKTRTPIDWMIDATTP